MASIFLKIIIILFAVAALFLIEKFIKEKEKEVNGAKWRLMVGVIQSILALIILLWLSKTHLSNAGHLLVIIGIIILALGGVAEIIIGILNFAISNKNKKRPHS